MIATIIIVGLAFIWLGYETSWLTVRLPRGPAQNQPKVNITRLWFKTFGFYHPYRNKGFFPCEQPYTRDSMPYHKPYALELSSGVYDTLCGAQWLEEHWHDLDNYQSKVELYFGNGYKQTFTLKKPELIGKIIHINTGKRYFRALAESGI